MTRVEEALIAVLITISSHKRSSHSFRNGHRWPAPHQQEPVDPSKSPPSRKLRGCGLPFDYDVSPPWVIDDVVRLIRNQKGGGSTPPVGSILNRSRSTVYRIAAGHRSRPESLVWVGSDWPATWRNTLKR